MPQIDISGSDSKISADKIQGQSGTTVTVQSGHSLSGDGSGLTALNGSNIASGTIASARLPALGKVLQVVASSNNTSNATTSTSEVDTANTVTITPTLATSKVLLYWSHPSMYTQSTDKIKMYLYMGGVSQGTLGDRIGEQNSGHSSMSGMRLFSPNSTSAVVFKTTYKRMAGGGTIFSNIYTGNQTMVAIEIGV